MTKNERYKFQLTFMSMNFITSGCAAPTSREHFIMCTYMMIRCCKTYGRWLVHVLRTLDAVSSCCLLLRISPITFSPGWQWWTVREEECRGQSAVSRCNGQWTAGCRVCKGTGAIVLTFRVMDSLGMGGLLFSLFQWRRMRDEQCVWEACGCDYCHTFRKIL